MATPTPSPETRKLLLATLAALVIAAVVLVTAVLPAEYGIDPTGIGRAAGFTRMSQTDPAVEATSSEGTRNETYAFEARFTLIEEEVGNWSGRLSTRDTQEDIRTRLNITNLTRLTARLEWTDDAPASGPDTLEVSIRGNGRASDLSQGKAGYANATLQWRSIPYPTPTSDGGLRLENTTDRTGHGEWRIVLRLYGTGATTEAPDDGNDWTLRLYAEHYELDTTSLEGAADRMILTLQPRMQVEYKFEMQPNATMTYRWNATAPAYSDLHADHFEDPDDFTSTKVATLTMDAGTYVAPYYGRHGWYWRNDGTDAVTITVETRGEYRILGVVG